MVKTSKLKKRALRPFLLSLDRSDLKRKWLDKEGIKCGGYRDKRKLKKMKFDAFDLSSAHDAIEAIKRKGIVAHNIRMEIWFDPTDMKTVWKAIMGMVKKKRK